jgi:hypothetical protein
LRRLFAFGNRNLREADFTTITASIIESSLIRQSVVDTVQF